MLSGSCQKRGAEWNNVALEILLRLANIVLAQAFDAEVQRGQFSPRKVNECSLSPTWYAICVNPQPESCYCGAATTVRGFAEMKSRTLLETHAFLENDSKYFSRSVHSWTMQVAKRIVL